MTVAGLPMYDWPEVGSHLDTLWSAIRERLVAAGFEAPTSLSRPESLEKIWRDPTMILGQVCSLNPVRDGLGETDVLGTIDYEPPAALTQCAPGEYQSVIVARGDDPRDAIVAFRGARVAANGEDSQSGYWSLGHHVRDLVADGPLFGPVEFTGAHRDSIKAVAAGHCDIAAIDVHSWRLALDHEPAADGLRVLGTTSPTPGVVCVISWELRQRRAAVSQIVGEVIADLNGTDTLRALHIRGYVPRRLEEFQVVADQVEAAARRPWHA